jgi:hypothetical protein
VSYFVICTFDLKNATRSDYEAAYSDLEKIGLTKVIVADGGRKVIIPTTTAGGAFTGTSAASVRDHVCDKVQQAFKARRFSSEIFVVVGGDWAWGGRTT